MGEEDAAGAEGAHGEGYPAVDEVGEGFEVGAAGEAALAAGDGVAVLREVPDGGVGELGAGEELVAGGVGEELLVALDLGGGGEEVGDEFGVVVGGHAHGGGEGGDGFDGYG